MLLEAGLITEQQLLTALKEHQASNMRLGDVLIHHRYITEKQLIEVLELQLGIPHVELYREQVDSRAIQLVPQRIAEQHLILPLRLEGQVLVIAMADPLDYSALEELRMSTGKQIEPKIASQNELRGAIRRYYGMQESLSQIMHTIPAVDPKPAKQHEEQDAPVVNIVNQMLEQAIQLQASDIHIDPQEDTLRIRYRIDGMMRTDRALPIRMQSVIVARLKIMADLNVAERRLPQDGRIEFQFGTRMVDIRVSTLPTVHGEKVVLRLLDSATALIAIENLGFSEHNLQLYREALAGSHGMVLLTGPTGSGKTTTLYAGLSRLNQEEVNIVTIEDPVEIQLTGINQVQVNMNTGLTFARGLRAILRQDPNVVMVGEIRDTETAEIAVRSAMTGHLVLSTLHTNNAVNAITRLIDMGIESYLLSSSLRSVIAQRLVRKVCTQCAKPYEPLEEERRLLHEHGMAVDQMRIGVGCRSCDYSGYRGRLAIHEIVMINADMASLILQQRSDHDYQECALRSGMIPMFKDGLHKVAQGLTTLSEVYRVVPSM